MKKLIFILTVLVWSGVLILLSFSREASNEKNNAANIDLREWEKLYGWNTGKKAFVEMSLASERDSVGTLSLHRFSPIDGIYYRSGDKKPFVLEKKGGVNIVTLGSGLFVCDIQTGLEKYEFHGSDIIITPKGRGVFLIDTTREEVKVFSFDTFLDTELVTGETRSRATNFTLFPSLLFTHDPKNTAELTGADILRISLIDSIRYVDLETMEDSKILFSWNEKDELLLAEVQKDITSRAQALAALYTSITERDNKKRGNAPFFTSESAFLINGSKKEILLKNMLVENITGLLYNPQKIQYQTTIHSIIAEMKDLSPKVYADGLALLKQYYYITTFSHFASKDTLFDFSAQEPPLLSLTEKIIASNTQAKQGEYYTHLGDLFSVYYFLTLGSEGLNNSFEKILQKMLDNKVLSKNEFLPFAFFVTQYLSTGPVIPNEDTLLIVSHLFQITNDYYTNSTPDKSKLATITSTTFYNYTKIFSKIYSVFLDTFIDKTPEGLLLKKQYISGENTNFDQSFVDAFVRVIGSAKEDIEAKKSALYSKNSFQPDSRVTDSYTLLSTTLQSFDIPISMFSNYSKYLNDFHLNESNKSARGILIEKGNEMSREILQAYLKNFNNLDISSIRVDNNFQKDGFYEIQATILGNAFTFKLWESGHVLADISYADTFGKKHVFPNITIPLDQKKEQLSELFNSSSDPTLQYKYDFKNFFETTFLKGDSIASTGTPQETTASPQDAWSTTPEIQLFIQNELLDKDFKNIKSFLPIGFKNIHASIDSSGSYVIELRDIDKTFTGEGDGHSTKLSGKYIFNRHSFSRLVFQVKKEGETGRYEFNEIPIQILPARLSLLSLPDSLKDLGYYIDAIRSSYKHQQSIIIDLTGGKVLLDNTPVIPKFPTP